MRHFEGRDVFLGLWFSLDNSDFALVAPWEFAESVVHPLIIGVRSEWSEGGIVLVDVFLGRGHLLLWERSRTDWADHIHWVVEGTVVKLLCILRLPGQRVERLLLKL